MCFWYNTPWNFLCNVFVFVKQLLLKKYPHPFSNYYPLIKKIPILNAMAIHTNTAERKKDKIWLLVTFWYTILLIHTIFCNDIKQKKLTTTRFLKTPPPPSPPVNIHSICIILICNINLELFLPSHYKDARQTRFNQPLFCHGYVHATRSLFWERTLHERSPFYVP